MEKTKALVRGHEDLRLFVYDDATGKPIKKGSVVIGNPTIGYGRNLSGYGITEYEAEVMLETNIRECLDDVAEITKSAVMDNRTRALVDMRYQMGHDGFLGFTKMIEAVLARDWQTAGDEALDSDYERKHLTRARAIREMIRNG